MPVKFTNNASTTLASGITNVATSITLTSGQGAQLPTLAGSDFFYATLQSVATQTLFEIVKVTARAGDVLTVVRGQEGTAASAFVTLDKLEVRVTAAGLAWKIDTDWSGTLTGAIAFATALGISSGGTNAASFTAPASNVAPLFYFDGTKFATDAVPAHAGYNTVTNTLTALNFAATGTMTAQTQILGFQSIATAGGTTTLTAASPFYTIFTGTQGQTVVLPNATTLAVGWKFAIDNDSTQSLTVNDGSGAGFWTIAPGTDLYLTCTGIGSTAGTWEKDYNAAKAATGKALTISNTLTLAGTDGQTFTFPNGSSTIVTTASLASPPAIGGTTPAAGSFTGVNVTGSTIPAVGIYRPATNTLGFATNSTQVGVWDASGNLGVNTTSPQGKFHVGLTADTTGGVVIQHQTSATLPLQCAVLGNYGGLNSNYGDLLLKARTDFGASYGIRFYTAAVNNTPLERMQIGAAGNVTINAPSSGTALTVNGNTGIANSVNGDASLTITNVNAGASASSRVTFNNGTNTTAAVGIFGASATTYNGVSANSLLLYQANAAGMTFLNDGAFPFYFQQGASRSMTLDASGNLGLGVTPSAFGAGQKAIQIYSGAVSSGAPTEIYITQNTYYDGAVNKYLNSNYASYYGQAVGQHVWGIAPSGTAGNTVTFTKVMTLDASGNLLVGRSTSDGRLSVQGIDATGFNNALSVKNSTPATLLFVRNDGLINTGSATSSPINYVVATGVKALYVDVSGSIGYTTSIREAKHNIAPIADVSWLLSLNPVNFNFKIKDVDGNYTDQIDTEKQYGLIADEVEKVNADFVFYGPDGKLRGVHYDRMIAPLIKVIQELAARIAILEAK